MSSIVVVGSGASGVHFALTALESGHRVTMLDVGYERPAPVRPEAAAPELVEQLEDPVSYLLGESLEGVVYPGTRDTFYGFPPSKAYVFDAPPAFGYRASRMRPYFTFARGGFAETWTAGVYPFAPGEIVDFPIDYGELRTAYRTVAARIGIGAERDDLEPFMPLEEEYLEPLEADPHSRRLLATYERRRDWLNRKLGWYLGRSRVATLSRDYRGRRGCARLGRCLAGCPHQAIYTPALTLQECMSHPAFTYLPGVYVTHFRYGSGDRVTAMEGVELASGGAFSIEADRFVLAAGAMMSSKIYLDSLYRRTGRVEALPGLMDNRQVHVPFLTLSMVGQAVERASYQFHHLAFGIAAADPKEYVHGQITTLKDASIHPIVQSLPLDLRSALAVFRRIRSGLGVANVNLADSRRDDSFLTLAPSPDSERTELLVQYASSPDEPERIRRAVATVKRALLRLGALVPPGLTRVLPKGTSVHYAGTLPMSAREAEHACTPDCRSYRFPNLYFVDGAVFPFLPAKNHTFTLMANAVRVAERIH